MRTKNSKKAWVVALRRNAALGYRQGLDHRPRWMGVNLWLTTDHFNRLVDVNPLDERGLRKTIRRVNRAVCKCKLPAAKRRMRIPLWTGELTSAVREKIEVAACKMAYQLEKHLHENIMGLDGLYGDLHIITRALDQMNGK